MNDKDASTGKKEREKINQASYWDDLTNLFYEAMTNYFPSSWNRFYGYGDDNEEESGQWHLWRRFLQKYAVSLDEIEAVCDQLVDKGERFAPNQGLIKLCLDNIRSKQGPSQLLSYYQSTIKWAYNLKHGLAHQPIDNNAIQALANSGGYQWHSDMHTAGEEKRAFDLWRDHYLHLMESGTDDYQVKLSSATKHRSKATATDCLMLQHAFKANGKSHELVKFAKSLGLRDEDIEALMQGLA